MPVEVVIPIRLKVSRRALRGAPEMIEEALSAALGRALDRSREAALAPRGRFVRPLPHAPTVTWTGDGLGELDAGERAAWEARLGNLVTHLANTALRPPPSGGDAAAPFSEPASEPWQKDRASRPGGYRIPAYEGGGKKVTLNLAPGSESVFVKALRVQIFDSADADDRTDGIRIAVALRNNKNKIIAREMRDILLVLVADNGFRDLGSYLTVVTHVGAAANSDDDWDILLEATGAAGSVVAEGHFAAWLALGDGGPALAYIRKRLSDADPWVRWKAARLVTFLLDPTLTPVTVKNREALRRLRQIAKGGLFVSGELGVASLWQHAVAQQSVLADTVDELAKIVAGSPSEDPKRAEDQRMLTVFAQSLRSRAQIGTNRGMFQTFAPDLAASFADLERLNGRLAKATELALRLLHLFPVLQENAAALRKFIGQADVESDEIASLFLLRHQYVDALTHALVLLMEAQTATGSDDWERRVFMADWTAETFDTFVSDAKLKRVTRNFYRAMETLAQANKAMGGPGSLPDPKFLAMRDATEKRRESLFRELSVQNQSIVAPGTANPFTGPISTTVIMPRPGGLYGMTRGLQWATELEKDVNLFNLEVALFLLYALAYRIHTVMLDAEIWTASFRAAEGAKLNALRKELADLFDRHDFKGFTDRAAALQASVRDAGDAIAAAAKKELFVHLVITLVAALVTAGAAAIARLALIGDVVAGIRTAQTAANVVFLVEAGTFTAVQLAGSKLVFGKTVGAGDAALALAGNTAFMGLFKVLGRIVGAVPLQNAIAKLAVPHLANVGVMTGISAIHTRIESGKWPENVREFLLFNVASYALIAGVNAGFRKLVEKPAIDAKVKAQLDWLEGASELLRNRFRASVELRTLTTADFEFMKSQKKEINRRELELARFLKSQGHLGPEELKLLEEGIAWENSRLDSATFIGFNAPKALTSGSGSSLAIRALMDPAEVAGLQRIGNTEVYRYDPAKPPAQMERLLGDYTGTGHRVLRLPGGLIRVETPVGGMAFLLEAGPAVRGLLPPAVVLDVTPPDTPARLLNLVVGAQSGPERAALEADLKRIHPQAVDVLQLQAQIGRIPVSAAVIALDLLVEQRAVAGATTWNLDAVRGLAEMMRPTRAISRATVRRLFLSFNAAELNTLFRDFYDIATSANVRSGVDFLVRGDVNPSTSARRIALYRKVMAAGMSLPEGMTIESIRGLERLARDRPGDWLTELARTKDLDKRLALLKRLDPIVDPSVPGPGDRIEMVLRKQHGDIRPNLNLLSQPPADVVKKIEALAPAGSGGGFTEPGVRDALIRVVRSYQENTAKLQAGDDVERNVVGGREEIEAAITALEEGAQIFQLGNFVKLKINPALFELPGGFRVVNAPLDLAVQMDIGAKRIDGTLFSVEATTGELSLPQFLQGLDPQSGVAGTDIDYTRFDTSNAAQRKWLQIIKLYNVARFATELGKAWRPAGSTAAVTPPELVLKAGRVTAPARRALTRLGFRVIETNP